MKIAIVEWFPRICGATDWAMHLSAGEDSSIEVDRLTFSKSGKSLKPWNRADMWTTHKIKDAAKVLNTYDAVILADIVCFAPQLAGKHMATPYYLDVMKKVKVPWTTMFHGGTYPSKYTPLMNEMLKTRGFTGKMITTRIAQATARMGELKKKVKLIHHPYLPYSVDERAMLRQKKRRRDIIMTARIAVNKGQNVMMAVMPKIFGRGTSLEMWGYNAFGLPSIGWRLWELGNALNYRPITKQPLLRADMQRLTHPRAHKFYTGRFEFGVGSRRIRYHDGYTHPSEIDWAPWLHVSLPTADFGDTPEYVTLDAIAYGSVAMVPEIAVREAPGHRRLITVPYTRAWIWSNQKGDVRFKLYDGDLTLNTIAERINETLGRNDAFLKDLQMRQYADLVKLHNPITVLSTIVEECL